VADFDPHQLDQLEDALDSLDQLDSLELSPALTERLAEYQSVLAVCRDAFPSAEPRPELLANVLAEAHAVSRRARLREPEQARWQRFWQRWRGTLVPGVALAGTAVAVLLLLEPERELSSEALLSDESSRARADDDAQQRTSAADQSPSEAASEPSVPDPIRVPDPNASNPDPPATQPEPKPASGAGTLTKPKSRKATPAIEAVPAAKPTPLSKDEAWTALERANADRRKGECDRARTRYEEIIAASHDSLAVARAKAGIGLCFEQDRRNADAQQWFDQARSGNAGIDAWIDSQRDEQPLPGETKKQPSANKASKTSSAESL
jgi:tetratricopeptide (TPR) repeat protein